MSNAEQEINCPQCAELIRPEAAIWRFCKSGISLEHFVECSFCGEMIRKGAVICRYCNRDVPASKKVKGTKRSDRLVIRTNPSQGKADRLGEYLMDQNAVENIERIAKGDLTDPKVRTLAMDSAAILRSLLDQIDTDKSVLGSMIVGHDGLPIASTLPAHYDSESISTYALGVVMNSIDNVQKLGYQRIHQIVALTSAGYIVIADFSGGLLLIFTSATDTDRLIPLMRKVTDLIGGV